MDEHSGQQPPVIAVVIPAFKAERHIEGVLAGIPDFVSHIVVVDDCSPDQTAALVQQSRDPRVHLVRHAENQGVGGATLSGYDMALALGATVVVKMDSDGQMDPGYIPNLIAPILNGHADYAKGNRFLHISELNTMPLARRIGNTGLSFLTKLASGYWNVFDPTNGFTAMHSSLIPLLKFAPIDRRFFFEISLLIQLGLHRAVVRDVYIPALYGNETSTLSERRALSEFPARLMIGFFRRLLLQYFVRDFGVFGVFCIAGLLLTLFGGTFGAIHWIRSIQTNVVASAGTVMLAVLPLILGVQLLLQAIVIDVQSPPTRPLQLDVDPRALTRTLLNRHDPK